MNKRKMLSTRNDGGFSMDSLHDSYHICKIANLGHPLAAALGSNATGYHPRNIRQKDKNC
jgi:hypothetical protein